MSSSHITTDAECKQCGEPLRLSCEGVSEGALDLVLECSDSCGAPVLNAFIPVSDFIEIT